MTDEFKPTPGSFPTPQQIKNGYWEWRRAHPEKTAKQGAFQQPCDECGGHGLLWFKLPRGKYPFRLEYVAICAYCANWQNQFASQDGLLVTTRQHLESMGCTVMPINGNRTEYHRAA